MIISKMIFLNVIAYFRLNIVRIMYVLFVNYLIPNGASILVLTCIVLYIKFRFNIAIICFGQPGKNSCSILCIMKNPQRDLLQQLKIFPVPQILLSAFTLISRKLTESIFMMTTKRTVFKN